MLATAFDAGLETKSWGKEGQGYTDMLTHNIQMCTCKFMEIKLWQINWGLALPPLKLYYAISTSVCKFPLQGIYGP